MKLHVLAVGTRMPAWVSEGFEAYACRFPPHLPMMLRELPLAPRGKNPDPRQLRTDECNRLLSAVPGNALKVALDGSGKALSTAELARRFENWMQGGRDVALLIGGPDGLTRDCLQAADQRWSLGPLTLPHPLVRIILAEQLYRAWSILNNHPYHRE